MELSFAFLLERYPTWFYTTIMTLVEDKITKSCPYCYCRWPRNNIHKEIDVIVSPVFFVLRNAMLASGFPYVVKAQ